jgi:hypothetical protein
MRPSPPRACISDCLPPFPELHPYPGRHRDFRPGGRKDSATTYGRRPKCRPAPRNPPAHVCAPGLGTGGRSLLPVPEPGTTVVLASANRLSWSPRHYSLQNSLLDHLFCVGGRIVECSQDLACQLMDWFSSSGYALRQTLGAIDSVWDGAGHRISRFFSEHGEKLTAMAGFGFATYKWWVYRERILYRRLEEYIRDSDKRLEPTSTQMMDAILRPGRTMALTQPAFAVEIGQILDTNGWRSFFGLMQVEHQANSQLHKALTGIRKREETALNAARSLQRQKAEVYKLRGAVASASARRATDKLRATELDEQALNAFRSALQCTTHRRDPRAKECEAIQYLRLGDLDLALAAFVELERFGRDHTNPRDRDLTLARAKRYQAHIMQLQAEPAGSLTAWIALARDNIDAAEGEFSAIELRRAHSPYSDWDAIEQAEMH